MKVGNEKFIVASRNQSLANQKKLNTSQNPNRFPFPGQKKEIFACASVEL